MGLELPIPGLKIRPSVLRSYAGHTLYMYNMAKSCSKIVCTCLIIDSLAHV